MGIFIKTKNLEKWVISITQVLLCLVLVSSNASAWTGRFQWSTRISVSEQYDDNIYLDKDNKEYDWITSVTPGLTLTVATEKTQVNLDYDLSLLTYARNEDYNTVRHSLNLSGFEDIPIAQHVTLDIVERFEVSDDPVETGEYVTSTRRTRERYYRNTAGARINYMFGMEDSLYVGFYHMLLENDEPDVEDRQSYQPMAGINYWFNIQHGLSLDYSYTRGEFDESDDYDEQVGRATYTYRFSPETQGNLSYTYDSFDYLGATEDYAAHSSSLELAHQFTEQVSGSISGGYYILDKEEGDNEGGFTGTASFSHSIEKGSIALSASTGYRQQFFEVENLGLSKFYSASARFDYQLMERLSTTFSGFYNRDDFQQETVADRKDQEWGGRAALNCLLLRWLSGSLSYQYRQRDSSIGANDYIDNRVTLMLTASYLGKQRFF